MKLVKIGFKFGRKIHVGSLFRGTENHLFKIENSQFPTKFENFLSLIKPQNIQANSGIFSTNIDGNFQMEIKNSTKKKKFGWHINRNRKIYEMIYGIWENQMQIFQVNGVFRNE